MRRSIYITDLDVPAAADVKQLRSLVEYEDEAGDLLVAREEEGCVARVGYIREIVDLPYGGLPDSDEYPS